MTDTPLGPLPKGWRAFTLDDVTSKIGSGATPRGGSQVYVADGPAFIRSQNVHDHRFHTKGLVRITAEAARQLAGVAVRPGDILLNITGESVARCCVVPDEALPAHVSQHVAIIRVDGAIDSRFVQYQLAHPTYKQYMLGHSSGGTRAALTKGHIQSFVVALPSFPEQQRIAKVLAALDEKIAVNARIAATAEAMAGCLLQSLLGRDGQSWEYSWPDIALSDALDVLEPGTRPKGGVSGILSGVPSIGAESIVGIGVFNYAKTKYVPEPFFVNMRRGHVVDRDVLLYKDGGRPGEFEPHVSLIGEGFPFESAAVNDHVYRVRVRPPYSQELLYFWLNSERLMDEMRKRGTGAAIPGLNSTNAKQLPLLAADPEHLARATSAIAPLVTRILRGARQSRMLGILRDDLVPRLMSGELAVDAATERIEAVA